MARKDPVVSSFELPTAPAGEGALPVRPKPYLHDRLRAWLCIMAWMLAAAMGLAAFMVAGNWEHVDRIKSPHLVLPLCVLCVASGALALRRGWLGVASVFLASSSVAVYLAVSTPYLTGGFYFAAFVVFCTLVSITSLARRAA